MADSSVIVMPLTYLICATGQTANIHEKNSTASPPGATKGWMEPRKYSTGTKGRIKMHADKCKEFIHTRTSFNLAKEYIESLDPDYDEAIWQRFQSPEDILPGLQAWLDGGDSAAPAPATSTPEIRKIRAIKPASELRSSVSKPDETLGKLLLWLDSDDVQVRLKSLSPREAAEVALRQFHKDLTD